MDSHIQPLVLGIPRCGYLFSDLEKLICVNGYEERCFIPYNISFYLQFGQLSHTLCVILGLLSVWV